MTTEGALPYEGSIAAERFGSTGIFTAFDLDHTLASGNPDERELKMREGIRHLNDLYGATEVLATARTASLVLTPESLATAGIYGFNALPAHRDVAFVDSENLMDPHVVIPFGEAPLAKYPDGSYRPDVRYETEFNPKWRSGMLKLLRQIDTPERDIESSFAPIESVENYVARKTNVSPLSHRIQLNPDSPEKLVRILERLRLARQLMPSLRYRIQDESNEERGTICVYFVPPGATKHAMLNRTLRDLSAVTGRSPRDARYLYAGDSPTDLYGIFTAGAGAEATGIIAPGRLTNRFDPKHPKWGMPFSGVQLGGISKRLRPDPERGEGYFLFTPPYGRERRIVNAGIAYPGLTGAEAAFEELAKFLKAS